MHLIELFCLFVFYLFSRMRIHLHIMHIDRQKCLLSFNIQPYVHTHTQKHPHTHQGFVAHVAAIVALFPKSGSYEPPTPTPNVVGP